MECSFDGAVAEGYRSRSQMARVLTEDWVNRQLYCPRCGNSYISRFPNNRVVADFFCPCCKSEYELKSKEGKIGKKIADGAYDTFVDRITGSDNPDFFVMSYDLQELCVNDLWIIPKHFFIPAIVEKRRPLSDTAKRAGWVGCNILLGEIPVQGRIGIVRNRVEISKEQVLAEMHRASLLEIKAMEARGWLLDVLNCVNRIPNLCFTLDDVYAFGDVLSKKYPNNRNVRPKIRQQMQRLRDCGFLEFMGRGKYRKL